MRLSQDSEMLFTDDCSDACILHWDLAEGYSRAVKQQQQKPDHHECSALTVKCHRYHTGLDVNREVLDHIMPCMS